MASVMRATRTICFDVVDTRTMSAPPAMPTGHRRRRTLHAVSSVRQPQHAPDGGLAGNADQRREVPTPCSSGSRRSNSRLWSGVLAKADAGVKDHVVVGDAGGLSNAVTILLGNLQSHPGTKSSYLRLTRWLCIRIAGTPAAAMTGAIVAVGQAAPIRR